MERLSKEIFYNAWLEKYHGITVEKLMETEPELCKTQDWYKKYAVTQKQHDEWYGWAIKTIMKHYRCSRKAAERGFCFDCLNISPSVRKDA